MNEARAIEFASDNNVTVSTDSVKRVQVRGKWSKVVTFKVGSRTVTKVEGQNWVTYQNGAAFTGRRGACIAFCVQAELDEC